MSMPRLLLAVATALITTLCCPMTSAAEQKPNDDPWLWLEDVGGDKALDWVRGRNAQSRQALQAWPRFNETRDALRAILDSQDRIPYVSRQGDHLVNFWRDAKQPRGLWRRTTLASYRQAQPEWEVLLDLDALAKAEGENWVWGGANCLAPERRRCLISLSRGGADAKVVREYDLVEKRFVPGGFTLAEAKSSVDWVDADTVLVGTDFGPGSFTDSGYPRIVKRWKRGQPLDQAVTLFEGEKTDVGVWAGVDLSIGHARTTLTRALDFYRSITLLLQPDGRWKPVPVPEDVRVSFWNDLALLRPRSDWTLAGQRYPSGALIAVDAQALMAGKPLTGALAPQLLFAPTATRSLSREGYTTTKSRLLLSVMDNVVGTLEEWQRQDGRWQHRVVATPGPGTLSAQALHDPERPEPAGGDPLAEQYLLNYVDFLTPDSLMLATAGSNRREPLKARPAFFDATGMKVEQLFATSKDGTRIPYFVVWPRGATADGNNPTLLYGYGGYEVSQRPWYSAGFGRAWYGQGGVLVVANIRGGGEFGPAWHQAAIKANKQKSYDDFAAVAEDLIARKITRPQRLGIQGGSNGGLLVGAVAVQRPELFNAVVCQVPLLDMRRFHLLLAGASWMAEYGNPDKPEEWAWISQYSPYQNLKPASSGAKLPRMLLTTSTRDDRVHPGHARKFAARLAEYGHDALYYENIEGGHGGAADNAQAADMQALAFAFLWQQLGR